MRGRCTRTRALQGPLPSASRSSATRSPRTVRVRGSGSFHQRPAPLPPTPAQTTRLTERLHTATAHPSRAAALAAAIATGASFQQLTTARTDGFHPADHTLTLHDRTRYTDGCAIYPIPPWAAVYLHAAARFAHLTSTPHLLAAPTDRPALLRLAETIGIRPPQPPAGRAGTRPGPVVWDWREQREALRHAPAPVGRR
ncbi:hypothetical protein K7B06_00785 [Streptomyces erythrochromogenes]|nr:hypothetical protein [Streptomyces erythrochromogenes]